MQAFEIFLLQPKANFLVIIIVTGLYDYYFFHLTQQQIWHQMDGELRVVNI